MSKKEFDKCKDCITIDHFVHSYLGISTDCSNLKHSGLKDLELPIVVGVSNDFAIDNPEYIYNGYLLMVIDSRNNKGTYINPKILYDLAFSEEIFKYKRELEKTMICDLTKIREHYDLFQNAELKCSQIVEYSSIIDELNKHQKMNSAKNYIKKVNKLLN